MAGQPFKYDVFLSHSAKDKVVVREVATRLRQDGLRVWFDEWVLKPGDSIPAMVEQGVKRSRVLVLCMSANAFGSDWSQLEAGTFQFRDPLNKQRRFVPLRLDDAPIEGTLAQFLYVDWRGADREQEYVKLREACKRPKAADGRTGEVVWEMEVQLDVAGTVYAYAFSPDGKRVITGNSGGSLCLSDVGTGRRVRDFLGHSGDFMGFADVTGISWSADQRVVLSSAASDETIRLWEVETGRCLRELDGDPDDVLEVCLSPDGRFALHDEERTLWLWNLETGGRQRAMEVNSGMVRSLAWSGDQLCALAGYSDGVIRLWNLADGECLGVLEGHTAGVCSLALIIGSCHLFHEGE
jgi:TIR domain/WD domain, G-beta repeat